MTEIYKETMRALKDYYKSKERLAQADETYFRLLNTPKFLLLREGALEAAEVELVKARMIFNSLGTDV